jgi:EF-P beta-lysylation protein EpmB
MRQAIRDPETLCERLGLPAALATAAKVGAEQFPLFAPLEYVARMTPGDPDDPLLRQVLPLAQEGVERPGFAADPLAEQAASLLPGLLQKYAGRALMITTGACAVHCRYCFRRHFPYASVPKSLDAWSDTLAHLRQDESIDEVLLSGGDPLSLVDELLARLVEAVAAIPHVQRIRVHTRFPIVIPQRITDRLIATFRDCRPTSWFVVHANHPQELDRATLAGLGRLIDAGIPVLNQAVLLRGVNDSVDVLERLCRRLVDHRVQPYYLHQLDRVQGAGHFEVDEATGLRLVGQLRERLPGYAVPQYVREIPAEASKTPLPGPGTNPTL